MNAGKQQPRADQRLWPCSLMLHTVWVWIGLECFGDNYMWVMDPRHPWIKDRLFPPLTTIINLPAAFLCATAACLLAYIAGWLVGTRAFSIVRYLLIAAVLTFLLALARGNFVVITGPMSVRGDNWYVRPFPERAALAAGATAVIVLVEAAVLLTLTRLAAADQPGLPADQTRV